jgi:hypothetical protein
VKGERNECIVEKKGETRRVTHRVIRKTENKGNNRREGKQMEAKGGEKWI